jgi:peptide/nickel transport system substrate-binding protein
MKTKRTVLLLLVAAALFLANCGKSGDSPAPPAEKSLVLGMDTSFISLDPAVNAEKAARMVISALNDTLLAGDPGGVKPGLAVAWSVSGDKLTYTFTLREDAQAATGKILDAYDAEFCFSRLAGLNLSPHAGLIAAVTATGDFELTVKLKEVNPSFPVALTDPAFSVYDSAAAQEAGASDDPAADSPLAMLDLGSGPFTLETYTPGESIVLKKNPNYWGAPASLETVILRHCEPEAEAALLEQGEIDIAFDINEAGGLDASTLRINTFPGPDLFYFMMTVSRASPFANAKVREAVYYGIDYEGLWRIAGNSARCPGSVFPEGFPGAVLERPFYRDTARAKQLLAEAGYGSGFTFECAVIQDVVLDSLSFMDCALKIQGDLAEIGLKMTIIPSGIIDFLGKMKSGKFQTCINVWAPASFDPAAPLAFLPGEDLGLRAGWTVAMSPQLANLAKQAKTETSLEAREELFRRIQDLYNEIPGPTLVFVQPCSAVPSSNRVKNLQYSGFGVLNLAAVDLERQ